MKMNDRNFNFIMLLFIVSAAISCTLYFKKYIQKDTVDIKKFPQKISSWSSQEIPITKEEYDILETQNAFVRKYFTPQGREAYLFIVYSQSNRKVSHPPEVCYIGSGVSVLEHSRDTVDVPSEKISIDVNKLQLARGTDKQIAFYWFKVGDTFTPSYWKQQMLIVLKTILGKPSSSALIRVSVSVIGNDETKALEEMKDFIRLITPEIFKYLP